MRSKMMNGNQIENQTKLCVICMYHLQQQTEPSIIHINIEQGTWNIHTYVYMWSNQRYSKADD